MWLRHWRSENKTFENNYWNGFYFFKNDTDFLLNIYFYVFKETEEQEMESMSYLTFFFKTLK